MYVLLWDLTQTQRQSKGKSRIVSGMPSRLDK